MSPEANRQKATVQVKVAIVNPDTYLRPEMNATVRFLANEEGKKSSGQASGVVVPTNAVRDHDGKKVVFIAFNGKALMRIGDNYAALGDYSHAVEAYKLAMTKPDGDAATANLHIGMALARAGDKAGATAALNAVTGPRAAAAKLWLTYVAQKA